MGQTIEFFMWGYQQHFRRGVEEMAEQVLQKIGFDGAPRVLLVGVLQGQAPYRHPVCIEPEKGPWTLEPFAGLKDEVEKAAEEHPNRNMFYGHERTMRLKAGRIFSSCVTAAVGRRLTESDRTSYSVAGPAVKVEDHFVCPVVQVPAEGPRPTPLPRPPNDTYLFYESFLEACLHEIVTAAAEVLELSEPGAEQGRLRSAEEIVRRAARQFLHMPGVLLNADGRGNDIFSTFNEVSALRYEGREGIGTVILADPGDTGLDYVLTLDQPAPLAELRGVRKLLQMATSDHSLVMSYKAVHGIGRWREPDEHAEQRFSVRFFDHYQWELLFGAEVILRARFGAAMLPQPPMNQARFTNNAMRVLKIGEIEAKALWDKLEVLTAQPGGNLLIIAEDAAVEAERLKGQGTAIRPQGASDELLMHSSRIDGAILISPDGVCHAIGMVLDGPPSPFCQPSRGGRFNSAVRYVHASDTRRLAIILSEDRTLDVVPLLRPRIPATRIEEALVALDRADRHDFHQPRYFLDQHRFYLNAEQCRRANAAMERINSLPVEVGMIIFGTTPFEPDPDMDEGYLC